MKAVAGETIGLFFVHAFCCVLTIVNAKPPWQRVYVDYAGAIQ